MNHRIILITLIITILNTATTALSQTVSLWWEPPLKGATAFGTALGDVNGDGYPDAALVHLQDPGYILLNDGNGHFTIHPSAPPLPSAASVAMGDLNGNGHNDLLIGTATSTSQVLTNDGTGAFFFTGQFIGPSAARRHVALADVNNDGSLDAILPSNSATTPTEVWTNNGVGTFAFASTAGSNWNQHVAVGDINGDGAPDLVFAANFANTVWTNNGTGQFFPAGSPLGTTENSFGVALGDLNGDGHLDALFANGPATPNTVWFGDGTGSFTDSGQTLGSNYSFAVILHDVDQDNDLDALIGNNSGHTNLVWLNNGSGFFSPAPVGLGVANAIALQTADLDGDGDNDYFVTVNGNPSEVWFRVPFAEGGPLKDSGQRIGGHQLLDVVPADFNGDGHLDIAYAASGQMFGLLTNNGTGFFASAPQQYFQGVNLGAIETLDYNADGFPDIVVGLDQASVGSSMQNRIWLNDGTGNFTPGPSLPVSRATYALAVADLTGNGLPDIIEGNRTTAPLPSENPTNRIHINLGGGLWSSVDALGGGWTEALAVGDLNGDHLPDIVVGNKDIPSTIWFNTGATQFIDSGYSLVSNAQDVVLADFTGNGALDLFLVASPQSILYTNDGNGAFSPSPENFFTTAFWMQAAALDLDGNGHQDLWLGNGSVGAVQDRYYLNGGGGDFTNTITVASANLSRALAVGDFTGNGMPDLFSAGNRGDSQLWTRQAGAGTVEQYAGTFGLTGPDALPYADPDEDGIPNVMEFAYNMNPGVPDAVAITNLANATSGLPAMSIIVTNQQPRFIARTIRLINSTYVTYQLEAADTLAFTGAVPATVNTTPLNASYERATYEYPAPGAPPTHNGRFRIEYHPQ